MPPVTSSARRLEVGGLAALLLGALAFRVVGMEQIEPNILPDEADHLALMYRILAGRGPGPFDLSWDGNPAFSLYPSLAFLGLLGSGYVALRLSVAFAGVAMLGAFYAVCRRHCSPPAALAATGLLAFSEWALFFSRNGEVNVFVALYAMLAAWSLQRAVDGKGRWPWAWTGFWAGMGWYGFLAGVFILPSLVLPLGFWFARRPHDRRRLVRGGALLVAVCALVVAPRVPTMYARWADVERYVEGRSVLRDVAPTEMPAVLAAQVGRTVRSWIILDPTIRGNARYGGPARAPLDGVNGTLYVAGLVVAAAGRGTALWWSLLLVPLAATQVFTTNIPDTARAIAALPAHFLFVGLAIDWLVRIAPSGALARAALIVAVPAVGWLNWQAYTTWMTTPEAAAARQPAVDYDEFSAWEAEQQRRARVDEAALTVNQWRDQHPRRAAAGPAAGPGPSRLGPSRSIGTDAPSPGPISARPLFGIQAGPDGQPPRGVAASASGEVIVAEPDGRTLRVGGDGRSLLPIAGTDGLGLRGAWDLAAGSDGSLYLVEAERDRIVRMTPSGQVVATIGDGWDMYRPRGLAVGPDGRLYVADTGRNRVVIATADGTRIASVGPRTSLGALDQPTDVAVDEEGRIYVALPELGRLAILDDRGRDLGGWDIARGDTVEGPHLALTSEGAIVVSEPSARRVRIFDAGARELGRIDADLRSPFGVAVAGTRLYVTDPSAGRLLTYELAEP